MLEVWQYGGVGMIHKDLRRAMRGRLTWNTSDAFIALSGKYNRKQVDTTIHNMLAGKHAVRISRGVYRFRGVV